MTSWQDVVVSAPEIAHIVGKSFAIRKHATMATVTRDGAPRISGTEIDFADDGEIYIGMMPDTRRGADLRRDPRVAIHCPTEDAPEGDPEAWLGDGKIAAHVIEVEPDRFRLDIDTVVLTRVVSDALEISIWQAATGAVRTERRT